MPRFNACNRFAASVVVAAGLERGAQTPHTVGAGRNYRPFPLAFRPPMATHLGPLKATCCEPRQARKGATVTAASGFG